MDGPLLDIGKSVAWRMLKLAKKRGYVTYDELDKVLPSDEISSEQIEDLLGRFSEMGINVVEAADEVESRYRYLARELLSFASGQRGQGRELLESAATALDAEANGLWSRYRPRWWTQREERWFVVFDQEYGIHIAEHNPSGHWIGQGGQRLMQVTHWRDLPRPPTPSM